MTEPRDDYRGEWDFRRQSDEFDRRDEISYRAAELRSERAIAEMAEARA